MRVVFYALSCNGTAKGVDERATERDGNLYSRDRVAARARPKIGVRTGSSAVENEFTTNDIYGIAVGISGPPVSRNRLTML